MMPLQRPRTSRLRAGWALLLGLALAACGGGGGGGGDTSGAAAPGCSVAEQNSWLSNYMNDQYFWYRQSPHPDPAPYTSVASYFSALLYTGTDARFPSDRWSNSLSSEAFDRFFTSGATLGYGVSVNGLEAIASNSTPVFVRYVDPGSPAAAADVQRGDEVLAVNGVAAAVLAARADFGALAAAAAGDVVALQLRRAGVERSVSLSATVYNLAPVPLAQVQRSAGGRKLGVLQVQQMISQATGPLDAAFAQFRAAGVDDLVLDLRYNGGGLVSVGATLASYIAGARGAGLAYASLLYNDRHQASNSSYGFSQPANALGLARVFVLAGPRTCSASEQVINGLIGAGLQVVVVGNTTCGKPVGFQPVSNCGQTYNVVNFESVNQLGQGRYFSGLDATCATAEDFGAAQDGTADPLLTTAGQFADSGRCPSGVPQVQPLRLRRAPEPGQFDAMLVR